MNKETDSRISIREGSLSVLGLEENATEQQIKQIYKTLVLKYHPDKQVGKSQEEQEQMREKFEIINKAYGVLTKSVTESLFDALADENLEESRNFLREVPNLNTQQYVSQYGIELTPIHLIVRNIGTNPGEGWEELLEQTVPIHHADSSELLKPININISLGEIGTPLHMACSKQSLHTVRHLLEAGADPNIKSDMGFTPADIALKNNNYDILKILINHGAKVDPNIELDGWGQETVLSYTVENSLRDDKGTLIVQQLFDHYKDQISPETIYSALIATNDNSLYSVKIILQNSHGLQKDHFNSMLDTRFNSEQYESYSLILSHVAKQGYNDVITKQYSQITKDLNDYQSFGDDQKVDQCKRFLDLIEEHRTISSPEHLKQGLVADKMKLFENTGKQEQKSEYKGISEIKQGSVAEKIAKFSAKDDQGNKEPDIREQPTTKVKDMVNKLEEKSNKESSNREKSHEKEVGKDLSHVSVSQLKQKFEER